MATTRPRCGVVKLGQETNTFSPLPSTFDDFVAHGLWTGGEAGIRSAGSNSEIAGALKRLSELELNPVPVLRGWAMPGGRLEDESFRRLAGLLHHQLKLAKPLDGLILCLHGALASESEHDADAALLAVAREAVGPGVPIVVTLDLHANVTTTMCERADALIGFHTYPHIDQASTGARGAQLVVQLMHGRRLEVALAKRSMVVPPEAQGTSEYPMRRIRELADAATGGGVQDVSLFAAQPWLDVPDLGFGVTIVGDDLETAQRAADQIADLAWDLRDDFAVKMVSPRVAIERARTRVDRRPAVLLHSSDSPSAGATADSAVVLDALERYGAGLESALAIVDAPAIGRCVGAGVGAELQLTLGATVDASWHPPVAVSATVLRLGDTPAILRGASMTGQPVSMGRWALIRTTEGVRVLLTERPAPTFDPSSFEVADVDVSTLDVISIRSANMFRGGYGSLLGDVHLLDVPGASPPNLRQLEFNNGAQLGYPFTDEVTR